MVGVGLGFRRLDPIKALFFAAAINGVIFGAKDGPTRRSAQPRYATTDADRPCAGVYPRDAMPDRVDLGHIDIWTIGPAVEYRTVPPADGLMAAVSGQLARLCALSYRRDSGIAHMFQGRGERRPLR